MWPQALLRSSAAMISLDRFWGFSCLSPNRESPLNSMCVFRVFFFFFSNIFKTCYWLTQQQIQSTTRTHANPTDNMNPSLPFAFLAIVNVVHRTLRLTCGDSPELQVRSVTTGLRFVIRAKETIVGMQWANYQSWRREQSRQVTLTLTNLGALICNSAKCVCTLQQKHLATFCQAAHNLPHCQSQKRIFPVVLMKMKVILHWPRRLNFN